MQPDRVANLLGAGVLALTDRLRAVTENAAHHGAAAPSALVTVRNYPGRTIEHLRRALGLTHSGTVRLVDRLVADGLLVRAPGPDRRSVILALTETGHAAAEAVTERRVAILREALDVLDPAEQAALGRALEKVLAGLVTDRVSVSRICRLCDEDACLADGHVCPAEAAIVPSGAPRHD